MENTNSSILQVTLISAFTTLILGTIALQSKPRTGPRQWLPVHAFSLRPWLALSPRTCSCGSKAGARLRNGRGLPRANNEAHVQFTAPSTPRRLAHSAGRPLAFRLREAVGRLQRRASCPLRSTAVPSRRSVRLMRPSYRLERNRPQQRSQRGRI